MDNAFQNALCGNLDVKGQLDTVDITGVIKVMVVLLNGVTNGLKILSGKT
jgi:hypothetical protein